MANRERAWDCEIAGYGYLVVRDERGRPQWASEPVAAVAGTGGGTSEMPRDWRSWHGGFGWAQALVPNAYYYAVNLDASTPRQIVMGPRLTSIALGGTASVSGFFEQSSQVYALAGRYAKLLNIGAGSASTAKDFGSGTSATVGVPFDSNTLVLFSSDTTSWRFDGTTWTQNTAQTIKGTYGAALWSDAAVAYVLMRSYTASGDPAVTWLAQGADLDSTDWSAAYDVGDDKYPITAVAARERRGFIAKQDGLYIVEATSGRSVRVLAVAPDTNNGKNTEVDSAGYVWYPAATGFYRYNPATGEALDVSPGRGLQPGPLGGRVTAQAEYRHWRYAAVWNGTDTYVLRGRRREEGEAGFGPLVWHGALAKIAGQQCWAMHVTYQPGYPVLLCGAGTNAVAFRLPNNADDPSADSGYRYAESGSIYLPADDWGVAGGRWQATGFVIENEGLSSVSYATLWAKSDHGEWQAIQTVQQAGRAPVNVPLAGFHPFARLALRLDLANPSSRSSPKITAISGRAMWRGDTRDVISTTLYCSDAALDRQGAPTRLSGQEQMDALKRMHRQGPQELLDWWTGGGRRRRVLVQPVPEGLVTQRGNEAAEAVARVTMAVLVDETISVDSPPLARYGTATYGQDRYSIGVPRPATEARYGTAVYGTNSYQE